MRIGLISDTHDERHTLSMALERFRQAQVKTVLHAGDVTSAFTLKLFADFDVWIARGNMDHDPKLALAVTEYFGAERLARIHDLSFNGARIAMTHGDSWQRLTALIRAPADDGRHCYVIYGHTHAPTDETIGATRVINPGAIGRARWRCATCAILDLATDDLQWIEL
ncbi:MAG: metallophosphoesterase family protein [Anaerolineae bacterium]|nr:metallophosphoesterase family protein [Anaerolineae bacterium]